MDGQHGVIRGPCSVCGAPLHTAEAHRTLGWERGSRVECRHCGRRIIFEQGVGWIDPEATGDDSIWRETCDSHDTFTAEHEPKGEE